MYTFPALNIKVLKESIGSIINLDARKGSENYADNVRIYEEEHDVDYADKFIACAFP